MIVWFQHQIDFFHFSVVTRLMFSLITSLLTTSFSTFSIFSLSEKNGKLFCVLRKFLDIEYQLQENIRL